ncbi:MAG TPA: hypothetical protein VKZ44_08370 [Taishania sp.]|nr:hypothetical protein [Taishania sp.]
MKKTNSFILLVFSLFLYFNSFSQVKLPITGIYKVTNDTYFDKVEIKEHSINTYQNDKLIGTFFVLENVNDIYIFEVTKPGTTSIDYTANRDRKLMKIKVVKLDENEYNFVITNPNGTTENVTLIK